jgi:hypothetical protein
MQGLLLRLVAERCLDGVEIIRREVPPSLLTSKYGVSGSVWFCYRSDRSDRTTIRDVSGLEDTLVVRFVNATDDDKRVAFLSRFGFPISRFGVRLVREYGLTEPYEWILGEQKELRGLLNRAGGDDPEIATKAANAALHDAGELELSLSGGHMVLIVRSPMTFMQIEVAMVAANGARLTTCETCGDVFLIGPLTARRSTARYCRDRCRVNAHRARTDFQK